MTAGAATGAGAGAESKRGGEQRRNNNRSSSSKNTLYYNDQPDPQAAGGGGGSYFSRGGGGGVWMISSLLDSCASGMQLLGTTCADTVSAAPNSHTCGSNNISNKITCQEDTENCVENSNNNHKKMSNNIIYKQTQSNNRRRLFNSNNNNNSSNNNNNMAVMGHDFAVLHDDFLESLLAEADGENHNNNASGSHHSVGGMDESLSSASSAGLFSRLDSSTVEGASAAAEEEEEEAARMAAKAAAAALRKRRRPLRLRKHKTLPPPPLLLQNNNSNNNSSNHQQQQYQSFAPQEGNSNNSLQQHHQEQYIMNDDSAAALHKRKNTDFSSSSSTLDSAANNHNNTDPSVFLHEHVRMQKDKGKGEAVGSNICAKGKLACLQKLRAKMRLLTEVALKDATSSSSVGGGAGGHCGSSNASTASSVTVATMKRKPARIALQTETFCETRSLIELKMGFLSMTYGVLLRWDITRTRTITLVVLRKNVYESFYPTTRLFSNEEPAQAQQQQQHPYKRHKEFTNNNNNASNNSSPSSSLSSSRLQGLKTNALLDPPYYVSRPLDLQLQPTILQVSVLYATGLNKRCNWTIQLLLQGRVESILLAYDPDRDRLYPKLGEALRHELSNASFSPSMPLLPPPLEIKLWEHTATARGGGGVRRIHNMNNNNNNSRKLVCAMRVSWDDLPISTSSSPSSTATTTDSTLVTVPCLHDVEHATIGLDVLFQSDYLCWMRQELLARRAHYHHRPPPTPVPPSNRSSVSSLPLSLCTSSREFVDIGCSSFSSNQGCIISPLQRQVDEQEEEEDANSPWEWICSVC